MSSLKSTIDKIKSLEVEKQNLLAELEGLKKLVDEKASALESEVGSLRDEVNSLKGLITGGPELVTPKAPTVA
jgi:chromosome segregation ATPase